MSETGRACRARGIWRTTRHTDKQAAQYTAADQTGKRVHGKLNGKVARHEGVARVGRVGEHVTRTLRGNSSSGIPALYTCWSTRRPHVPSVSYTDSPSILPLYKRGAYYAED